MKRQIYHTKAESSSMGYEAFLVRLLEAEEAGKLGRRMEKLCKEANL